MSLPINADVSPNCDPANCIPSPESPAKRMDTLDSFTTGLRSPGPFDKTP